MARKTARPRARGGGTTTMPLEDQNPDWPGPFGGLWGRLLAWF
ncbi:MAG TPA: hypothetical protein VGN96_14610 [Roseococcus sp.]|nr:hypothetical protein [Roseococcus sp.]